MRPLRAVAHAHVHGLLFLCALAFGVFVNIGALPFARQVLRLRINRVLSPLFVGRITIDRIGSLGLHGIDGLDAHVDDGDGKRVIDVHGASAQVSTEALVRSLFEARGPLDIAIPELTLGNAEVHLDADGTGDLRIARAFALRDPPKAGGPPGRDARIALPRIHILHALLLAQPTAPNDADLDDADAALLFSPDGLTIDLSRSHLVVRGLPENTDAKGAAEARLAKPEGGAFSLRASWQGTVGAVAGHATVAIDGDKLDGSADAGPATPEQARGLLPAWPLAVPVAVHAEAHGVLPRLTITARATAEAGVVTIEGPVTVGPAIAAVLHVQAEGVAGTWLSPPLPFANARGAGDVTFALAPNGAASAHTVFTLDGAEWSGIGVPSTTVTADVAHAPDAPTTLQANLAIREPGAPATVALRLAPSGGKTRLTFDATVAAPRLEAVPLLRHAVAGAATARATGSIDLGAGTLTAAATATVDGLRAGAGAVAAAHAHAEMAATGPLGAPSVRVALDAEDLEAGPLHARSLRADATAVPSAGGVALRDVEVDLENHGASLRFQAAGARADARGLAVDDAVVLGLGAPLGVSFALSPSGVSVHAEGAGVDLARVASFLPTPVASGNVAVDADATVQRDAAQGHAKLDLTAADVAGFAGTTAHVDLRVRGREIRGSATATAPDLGRLQVDSSSLEVGPGNLVTAEPWRQAWGAIDVTADVDLTKALARFASLSPSRSPGPAAKAAFDARGSVRAGLRLERDSPSDVTPEVELTVGTTGLVIAGGEPKAPWRIEGIDPRLHAVVDGQTGATSLALELHDEGGTLATLEATSAAVPYGTVFSSASAEAILGAMRTMPFAARAEIPGRALASLPALLGTEGIRGSLSAKVDWHGSVEKPRVVAVATLARGPADAKAVALPLDFALSARYDGAAGDVLLTGSRRGATLLRATGTVSALAPDILDGIATGTFPWTASAKATLHNVPLRNLQALDDRQVQGTVSGEITLANLHEDAQAKADLSFDDLEVGDATCRSALFTASADAKAFDATLRIDDSNGGHLRANAHSGLHWGRALVPAVDVAQAANAAIEAQHFRAALLLPFVTGSFTELDGTLDGNARIAIDPSRGTVTPEGTVRLKDGLFELASVGGEFHGVEATLALSKDGIVRLENAIAHGTSGQVQASATARLSGMSWSAARATVQMPRTDPLPLIFDGVLLGQLDGRFDVALTRTAGGMDVNLQVPSMHVALPEGSASRDVQSLGGLEGVSIGRDRRGEFVEMPLDGAVPQATSSGATPFTTRIAVRLGNDVQIARGTDLDVHLEGQPSITIGSDVRVTGQIRLVRGTLDVKGKAFAIQQGTVTFTGEDPSNPQVVLAAGWTAPDGTLIYADFVGPLKTGKVTLRSEPVRPQNEIITLLLFGTVEDAPGSNQAAPDVNLQVSGSESQGAIVAGQAGGAVATAPINQALGGLNRTLDRLGLTGGVSTRIDTSTSNPRPEVAVQIARDISFQVGYVLGVPPVTNPDTTLVTLNWNFLRKWSLEATYGDAGSSILDVVWQHRY
ncbi:MAG TPA: translocation/assembly module TamB domain-containing protein [Polyangiaceae bacterium]|jgi:translocation and assembly module TamB|nr:translocation/assembly module TamB domain-containing protein [Polyangiaceae bacterium]